MIDVPVEIKDALREGTYKKNYRFVVLNDDGTEDFTIDNDNLVSESVSIDERMCSGDKLKFGLCEGSSIEFQYFNKPNITGKRVQAFVDVEYEKVVTQYVWETQASFNEFYTITGMSGECRVFNPEPNAWEFMWVDEDGQSTRVYSESSEDGTVVPLGDVTGRTFLVSKPVIPEHHLGYVQLLVPHEVPTIFTHTIPMGYFDIKKCSRQASTGIIKATGYNKLQSEYLDAKANEKIVEVVDTGIIGRTGEAALSTILDNLLDGYAIERKYSFVQFDGATPAISTYADYDIPEESKALGYLLQWMSLDINNINRSKIYRLWMSCKRLYEKALSYAPQQYLSSTVYDIYYSDRWDSRYPGLLSDKIAGTDAHPLVMEVRIAIEGHSTLRYQINGINRTEESKFTEWFTNVKSYWTPARNDFATVIIPVFWKEITWQSAYGTAPNMNWSDAEIATAQARVNELINNDEYLTFQEQDVTTIESQIITSAQAEALQDVTLRDLQSAVFEMNCTFGQLSRITDLFSGVELNHSRLYPADTLYPATDLYPSGAALSGFKSMYSKLWADEGNVHKWRYLIITYKGLDEEQNEVDYTLQRTVNADGTDDYNMSDNWLFRNLVWTAEQVGDYADAMVAKMQDVTWFPFEMWCAGLPYLETGDEIEIPINGESYTSYVLQRQLKGIQNLQDTYINGTLDIF